MIINNNTSQVMSDCLNQNFIKKLGLSVKNNVYWGNNIRRINLSNNSSPFAIHLAILVEPYLEFILDGKKTIESRFSVNRVAPYKQVCKGDMILLKRSSGPIVGVCEVSSVWFYQLDPKSWHEIKADYARAICVQDPSFWLQRKRASFATLMQIIHPLKIAPIQWRKRDRRGWVVLWDRQYQSSLYRENDTLDDA